MKSKIDFIESELPKLVMNRQIFECQEILKCCAEPKVHLDGFMSSIFTVEITVKESDGR